MKLATTLVLVAVAWSAEPERKWGNRAGALQLSAASDKVRYLVGEPILVDLRLRNASAGRVGVQSQRTDLLFEFDVALGSSAERAALTPFGISKTTSGRSDMAGSTMDASQEALFMPIDLAAYFTMTQPGEYRVVVSCRKQFIPKDSTLSSNELRIVVEGQPK